MAVALGEIDARAAVQDGPVELGPEGPADTGAGKGKGQGPAALRPRGYGESVINVERAPAVYAHKGEIAGRERAGCGIVRELSHPVSEGLPPRIAGFVARAVVPEIVMRGDLPPGHEKLHGDMRHLGEALDEKFPEGFLFLALGVGHVGAQHALKALRHLRSGITGRPFLRRGEPVLHRVPERVHERHALGENGLAPLLGFVLGVAPGRVLFGIDLEDGRREAETGLGRKQGMGVRRHGILVRIRHEKLREPARRRLCHFALSHFPELLHGNFAGQGVALRCRGLKRFHDPVPGHGGKARHHGAGPGQYPGGRQLGFAAVGKKKPEAPPGFLRHHAYLRRIGLKIFDNAARRWEL